MYKLCGENKYITEKWYNSIKMIKEMGDLNNLDPQRYEKLNVYTKLTGRITFKDYEILIENYEHHICEKIVQYKYDKIFILITQK